MSKFITGIFLFLACSLQGQEHEIKIDAVTPLYGQFNFSYEWLFNDKLGIEGGIGYLYGPERLDTTNYSLPVLPGKYGTIPFKKRAWSFLVSAKYYFSPKPKGNRLFLGTFIQYRTKAKIEDAYYKTYETYFNEPDPYPPTASLFIGGAVGYKILLFKQKVILEPILGLGIDIEESEFDVGGFGIAFRGLMRLNLGYRF